MYVFTESSFAAINVLMQVSKEENIYKQKIMRGKEKKNWQKKRKEEKETEREKEENWLVKHLSQIEPQGNRNFVSIEFTQREKEKYVIEKITERKK